jgi:cell division protein FtsB
MGNNFYDDDLTTGTDQREGTLVAEDSSISYHAHSKRQLPEEVNKTTNEIERLRQRQENLERRKQELNEQRRRIESFENNRRDLLDKLRRSAVLVVREGEQASRMAALCSEIGALFSRLHKEMESFFPERWGEENYDALLTEALAKIESANNEYRRAMDKINALGWSRSQDHSGSGVIDMDSGDLASSQIPRSFGGWFMVGLAFSLPLAILISLFSLLFHLLKTVP